MIDWLGVAASVLWIGGCALALTVLSIARWESVVHGQPLRTELARSNRRVIFYVAGALFCAGWVISPMWSWEQLVWTALALLFAQQAWRAARHPLGRRAAEM